MRSVLKNYVSIHIDGEKKGQLTEVVTETGLYHRYVTYRDPSNYMKKYSGFGITKKLLEALPEYCSQIVVLYERQAGGKNAYIASPEHWLEKGAVNQFPGFEEQVFLSEDQFQHLSGVDFTDESDNYYPTEENEICKL